MKKRILALVLLFALLLALVSCGGEPSSVSVHPKETDSNEIYVTEQDLAVNTLTKKIHTDASCHHLKNAAQENLRSLPHTKENVNTLLAMQYTFCSHCQKTAEEE